VKIRESGMPPEDVWDEFFDAEGILDSLGLDTSVADVAEFGCGYGTFTLPAASRVSGTVYTSDIDREMLAVATRNAAAAGIHNIECSLRDFVGEGSGLPDQSVDFAMLFNILHVENPVSLLQEAYRNLKVGGRLGIIHWVCDEETPRGPPLAIRPGYEQCRDWAIDAGFSRVGEKLDLPPWHYGLVAER
jgi:SAM-dependent methyltransferase